MHGYEEGFHSGDLDVQLGRSPRDPSSLDPYRHPTAEYHPQFGPKPSFKDGFHDGFLAGYSDAVHMQPFRAVKSLREAASGLASDVKEPREFDKGFREGYEHGRLQGAGDARDSAAMDPISPPCLGLPTAYCDGYARAFNMGYIDGYENLKLSRGQNLQVIAGQ